MLSAKLIWLGLGALSAATVVTTTLVSRNDSASKETPAPESASTSPPPVATPTATLTFPPPDPATCDAARAAMAELTAWLETELSNELRSNITARVAELAASESQAKSWNDVGVVYYLNGDACAAAWCGLHAVRLEWAAQYVANCGVFLIGANRLDDALTFLLCAYGLGLRSPYLLEALGTLHQLLNDPPRAREYILLANAIVPGDPLITAASRLVAGDPLDDSTRPDRPPHDDLNVLFEELRAHVTRHVRKLDAVAALLDDIEQDPETKKFRDEFVQIGRTWSEQQLVFVAEAIARTRYTRSDHAAATGQPVGGAGFEESFQATLRAFLNGAYGMCAMVHMSITDDALCALGDKYFTSPGFRVLFWSQALDLSPVRLGEEMRLEWQTFPPPEPDRIGRTPSCQDSRLDDPFWVEYTRSNSESYRQHDREWHACNAIEDAAARDACQARADAGHCDRIATAFGLLARASTQRLNLGAANFSRAAIGRLLEGEHEVLRSREYVRRCFARMAFSSISWNGPTGPTNERELMLRSYTDTYRDLIQRLIDPADATYGVAKRLNEEAEFFGWELEDVRERYDRERDSIARGGSIAGGHTYACSELPEPRWEALRNAPFLAFLARLRTRLETDFAAEFTRETTVCRLRVAYCVVNADEDGRFAAGLDCARTDGCGGPFDLIAVAVSPIAGDSGAGAATTLVTGKSTAGGLWDYSVALTTPENQPAARHRTLYGHLWAVALPCYPEDASPHFAARAVLPGAGRALREALSRR
ncbi:MAG: hypothetical protein ACKVX7_18520 [Planctomycetota bacterium]